MMNKKMYLNEKLWYFLLLGFGIIFLLFFSTSTSPLTFNTHGSDSAFFRMIGQNMTKGLVMYRDMFDHKGPYLYILQYLGQCLSYGRYGIFFIQCINLFFLLYLADLGCRLVCVHRNWNYRIISISVIFFLLEFSFEGGNLSEEYSLPLLMLCLLLFFKYVQDKKVNRVLFGSFIMGLVFGILAFMRITNASLICVLIIVMFVDLLLDRKIGVLLLGMTGFVMGFLVTCIPICIYYLFKGALSDMLYATFVFNFIYANQNPGRLRYEIIIILIVVALFAAWLNRNERAYFLFAMLSMFVTIGVLLLGNAYLHYYQLIIPPVLGNLWLIMRKYDEILFYRKKLCIGIFILLMFLLNSYHIAVQGGMTIVAIAFNTPEMENSMLGSVAHFIEKYSVNGKVVQGYAEMEIISDIMNKIPLEAQNKVFSYNTVPQWLCVTELSPYIKYCLDQECYISLCPQIEEEIDEMLENAPPEYIVLQDYNRIKNEKLRIRLEKYYKCVYENEEYFLYQIINLSN